MQKIVKIKNLNISCTHLMNIKDFLYLDNFVMDILDNKKNALIKLDVP